MAAVPPALVPKLHNSVFSCMSLVPLELPPLQWRPGDVCQQVSLCGELLRGYPGFQPLAISPRWADRVLANFHCQMFWVLLWTPGLGSLAWGWELSIFRPGGGCTSTTKVSLLYVGLGSACFRLSTPLISLDVASSLYP